MPRRISPRRNLAPPPLYVPLPDAVGIKDPAVASTINSVIKQLNAVANYVRQQTTAPQLPPPTGPNSPVVSPGAGSTHVVQFYSDPSGPNIDLYRVWRAPAGTRLSPTDPGPDSAVCVGTVTPSRLEDGSLHRHLEREFSITDMDPANPARFKYWVTSIDDRQIESAFVEASGGPIETVVNGPGDQSPEQKFVPLNKLFMAGRISDNGATQNIDAPYVITASTNATPIVVTVGAGHGFAVGDIAVIDGHTVNTNANGWWKVSAIAATTITLQNEAGGNSVGNGVGGNTGRAYRVPQRMGFQFAPSTHNLSPVANGASRNYLQPAPLVGLGVQNNLCCYIPWYSQTLTVGTYAGNTPALQIANPGAGPSISYIAQEIGFRKFNNPMSLCVSFYAKWAAGAATDSSLGFDVRYEDGTLLFTTAWDQTVVTTAYQRFVFNFRLSATPPNGAGQNRLVFRFYNACSSGTPRAVDMIYPMVSIGDVIPAWTEMMDWSDHNESSSIGVNDLPWGRSLYQNLKRDASAPYA